MAEMITLEVNENIAQRARETAQRTGRLFEDVLKEWLSRGAEIESAHFPEPGVEYPIYTPYGNEAAAEILRQALLASQQSKDE